MPTSDRPTEPDSVWHSPDSDWRQAQVIAAGLDIGSTTSQAVVLTDGRIYSYSSFRMGADTPDISSKSLATLLQDTGMATDDIHFTVGTGCGDPNFAIVNRIVSEIACHARAARHSLGPSIRTVLAMGGRDCAAIACGQSGDVASFLSNACRPAVCRENLCNACGAAQGQAIDAVAEALDVPIENVGPMSLGVDDQDIARRLCLPHDEREFIDDDMLDEISDEIILPGAPSHLSGILGVVCSVLARNQAAGLLRNGWSPPEVLAAYCAALAHQAAQLVKRLGVTPDLAISGGVARNIGVAARLESELGISPIPVSPDPQIAAALGAALHAADFVRDSHHVR